MRYTFELHNGESPISDDGWFTSRERALDHAQTVARDLMFGRELECRSWHLDVCENGSLIHELLFATVDPTLDHVRPALRASIEHSCETRHRYNEGLQAAHSSMREARALVARSRGKPYLATERGEPTMRTSRDN